MVVVVVVEMEVGVVVEVVVSVGTEVDPVNNTTHLPETALFQWDSILVDTTPK